MSNSLSPSDHDFLTRLEENVRINFEQVKDQITRLEDGTATRLANLEVRTENLEKVTDNNDTKYKLIIAIGILLVGLLIWHLTGYGANL
jgi:hypothetical protein